MNIHNAYNKNTTRKQNKLQCLRNEIKKQGTYMQLRQ